MSLINNDAPQFATAEYAGGGDRCKSCKQPIAGAYYRINGSLACERCTTQLQSQLPTDSHAAFVRGIVFGVGAAIVGLILYAAFGIITGIVIGYAALGVGWLVGKAMRKGSRGMGGLRYQITAAALTYAAVSMAAVPIYLWQTQKPKPAHVQPATSSSQNPAANSDDAAVAASATEGPDQEDKPKIGFFMAMGTLMAIGLASPFIELQNPLGGAIGLIILFVGMRFAWQQTAAAKMDIIGPFYSRPESPSPTS
jgi:hypothetical protein